MRGIYSNKTEIRHKVFTEVARMAFEGGDFTRIEELPYKIIPGEIGKYYNNVFLERAIVGERLRATIGLPIRKMSVHAPLSDGIDASAIDEKYYDPPLINIIKFACHACPEKKIFVTNGCQGCIEHPCVEVCPKGAIHMENGHSVIEQDKCIKCGKCLNACPYNAIIKQERPCAAACGMNAIKSDEYGRADIDYDLCVSCGMCLVSCPFSAIVDKSQIFQTVLALKSDTPIYAAIAPSFIKQFGDNVTPAMVRAALKAVGFEEMEEVAIGADLCAIQEAVDFMKEVPAKHSWMGTSCCPAWSVMAKKTFPEYADHISMTLTPMVLTGRMIKKRHPDCKVVFIGPCAAKKLEASRRSVRSDIDFVLTFEEMMGIFDAKGVDFNNLEVEELRQTSSSLGKGFAASGGVAEAVVNVLHCIEPDMEVKTVKAEGLVECKKMLAMAKAGKYDGYLLEGMACPGGCVGGAGVLSDVRKATIGLEQDKAKSEIKKPSQSDYLKYLHLITKEELYEDEN
ncbi:4Fe-4S dicluster domain-containing protein [uncultured Eubacterium sp.]|uniref:4Fe-4S dicluster domain-containing protein n=1 Tax=uncultured Eubacterium sp. TaxID=165185 RepID=UPI00267259F0|nr:4Fe-4S dicluster domain-containing protein [uncultured Eubacterium sp.]